MLRRFLILMAEEIMFRRNEEMLDADGRHGGMGMRRRAVPKSIHNLFSAVLLAGGRSTRMGRDKAALEIEGEPLWSRQLAILRATGSSELFISGRPDGPYAESGVPIIEDLTPDTGPLAALEAVLPRIANPHVIVLAIDLPAMRADFLAALVQTPLAKDCSVVPEINGRFEPLAAVYAPSLLPLVIECLHGRDHSMQNLLRKANQSGLVIAHPVRAEERSFFKNLNSPIDLA